MKTQLKPTRKKTPRKGPDPSEKNRSAPSVPETRQGSGAKSAPESVEAPSKEEVVSNWSNPVTNQDEQDKITNAGEGDIPIANK